MIDDAADTTRGMATAGSLSRLPRVERESLDEQGKKNYDTVADPHHRLYAKLQGPPAFWLHIPDLLVHIREINWHLRNQESGLEKRLRELTTLVAARENDCQYEWSAHEPHAVNAGLDANVIDVVKHRKPVAGLPEKESAIITFGRQVLRDKQVSPGNYARAVRALGERGVVHMIALLSNYTMTAVIFNSIDQKLRPGQAPLLPIP